MRTFKYHSKNLPHLYPTNSSAPCRACGSAGGCEANFDRTVYLCKQMTSTNHIESRSAWVHRYDSKNFGHDECANYFEGCKHHHDAVVRDALCKFLGVDSTELHTYPFGFDTAQTLASLPVTSAPGVYSGIVLFDVTGPNAPKQFMLRHSHTGPAFPVRPPQSGPFLGSLICAFDLGDALHAQALGFDTCALTNPCVNDAAAAAVGMYAVAHGFSDIVMVARSTNPLRRPQVLMQAARKLHKQSGGLPVFDAEVPERMASFAVWANNASFSRGQRLPNERLLLGDPR